MELENLANAATFFVLIVTGLTLFLNRRKIWRDKLTEKQLDHLLKLNSDLYNAATNSFTVKYWADNILQLNRTLEDFRIQQPHDFQRQVEMQLFFQNLINQSALNNHVLFPDTFDTIHLTNYSHFLTEFAPFSFYRFSQLTTEQIQTLQAQTFSLINEINQTIRRT
jgi:hypothetical protein